MILLKNILKEINLMGTSTSDLLDKVLKFENKTLIFFDTETMGLNPHGGEANQLLEIGIIVINGTTMAELESHNIKIRLSPETKTLFSPNSPARAQWDRNKEKKSYRTPAQILSMTNYFSDKPGTDLNEKESLELFDSIIKKYEDPILIAHNATFDMGFINVRAQKYEIKLKKVPVIDTLRISQLYFIPILQATKSKLISDLKFSKTMKVVDIKPKDPHQPKPPRHPETEFEKSLDDKTGEELLTIKAGYPSSSLGKLSTALFGKVENWHSALADTKTMINVFQKIIEYLKIHKELDIRREKEMALVKLKSRENKGK